MGRRNWLFPTFSGASVCDYRRQTFKDVTQVDFFITSILLRVLVVEAGIYIYT